MKDATGTVIAVSNTGALIARGHELLNLEGHTGHDFLRSMEIPQPPR